MKVQIEFHGVLRRLSGVDALSLELPEGATVADALEQLQDSAELASRLESCACALESDLIPRTQSLHDGCTLVLIPPVSGG